MPSTRRWSTGPPRPSAPPTASGGVRELRLRWIGHRLRAEADITADPELTITEAHELAHQAEDQLLADVPRLNAATVHISPVGAHPEVGPADPSAPIETAG